MIEDDHFSLHANSTPGQEPADARSGADETEKVEGPPTLLIRETSIRDLVRNSIYLIITTLLISATDSWSYLMSKIFFAVMVLKFGASVWMASAKYMLILSDRGVRVRQGYLHRWDDLIDFYLEAEVPNESPERLVVILRGGKLMRVLDYRFELADLDADRKDIVEWVRFYGRYFRK